jgi:hypothetical protein
VRRVSRHVGIAPAIGVVMVAISFFPDHPSRRVAADRSPRALCPDRCGVPRGTTPLSALTSDAFNRGEPSLRPLRLDRDDELRRLDRPD